jgi:hypothetical protein
MSDSAVATRAFPLKAPSITTSGANEPSPHPLLATRVARSPGKASPELKASPRSGESAIAPALDPAAGTTACMLGASSRLERASTAGAGAFSVSPAAVSRVLSWLGESGEVQMAAAFPAVASSVAGGGDRSAPTGAVDGFHVARTRGTTRRTQGFERRGLNVGDLGSQRNTVTDAPIVERATHCREGDRALPRFRALVVR